MEALWQILSHQTYTEEDLFYAGGCWHSWRNHSAFSSPATAASFVDPINTRLEQASAGLPQLDWLVITGGLHLLYAGWRKDYGGRKHTTARWQPFYLTGIYGRGNCHWMGMCVGGNWESKSVLEDTFQLSAPYGIAKDGKYGNQISKSTLLLRWMNYAAAGLIVTISLHKSWWGAFRNKPTGYV